MNSLNPLQTTGPAGGIPLAPPATIGMLNKPGLSLEQRKALAHKSAQDFESFFVTSMLEEMDAGLKTDKMFGGGPGEQMYRSLLNQEYGKAIAERGSLGISDMVQREILRLQEKK
jgi:peptidoglycan hydrolase FlgJ